MSRANLMDELIESVCALEAQLHDLRSAAEHDPAVHVRTREIERRLVEIDHAMPVFVVSPTGPLAFPT